MRESGKARRRASLRWRKSSHSEIDECVEVSLDGRVLFLRDSKDPDGPVIRMAPAAREAFAAALRQFIDG
ncbi:DUF397 domain-containing protein [Actinomadura geliboluensis]|jgi:hypothetical protein|uniref:DUF397 domain-containing protein n=1 Tax=Actinomadura geliboluensis TaxID=882440 RepID=UPI003721DB3D